ncbi:hypothetical protein BC827DRAFT_1238381 [Russula dissimulans]|nr:hypothetical protein BC827DRAFT_1238381 [Russula dissimulans]
MFLFTSIQVVLYAIIIQLVHALPFEKRLVIDPSITSPSADTVWTPGNEELVTWDPSMVPATGNYTGTLLLGNPNANGENLDLNNPLADGFSLRDGSVRVICPKVPPGNTYIVVLFGDSGNASPRFTITSVNDGSGQLDLVPGPSGGPSSADPAPASTTSTTSTTPAPLSPANLTPTSDSPSQTWTSSTSSATPLMTSPAGYTPSSASPSKDYASSSASATSASPVPDSKSNGAILHTLNAGAMTICAVVVVS